MTTTDLTTTAFTSAHIPAATRLSQAEHWPHRPQDWAFNLSVSRGVVALNGERLVGTALCSLLGEVATINLVIVDASMRGRGLGRRLMTEAMALAGPRETRLVATSDGLPLYEKLGFVACGRILQHQGIARAAAPSQPVTEGALDDLLALDRQATGMDRAALLRAIAQDGQILQTAGGIATLRPFGRGHVLGPVLAQTPEAAAALIAAAASRLEGQFLRIDLPEDAGLDGLARDLGLTHAGGGIPMRLNPRPASAASPWRIFALMSQALG
ncbi:GNAT family N-acetyltransferase [Paracoccus nototheniae]|uniref:GNAT family N-acetyltransferase n=1 Tax=Paracoccus nototheniae TaxID=2489002 RepID=UPI001038A174|nr:GNAT family N-acetyltransferase [Paracoccus nototheniae]